jgi:ribosomal protein S18 acetylase RimI-like enzyme
MDPHTHIQIATPQDAALLAALGEQAFREAFAKDNTPEDMATYLSQNFSPEIQAAEIARVGSIFLIFEVDGQPAGYARLQDGASDASLASSETWHSTHPMELVRIYLLQAYTGRHLADRLMQVCLDQARSRGVDVLWLGVWQHNARAIAFYRRWGFEIAGTHHFQLGQDLQTDNVMALRFH